MSVPPPWQPPSFLKKLVGFLLLTALIVGVLALAGYVFYEATKGMPTEWKVDRPLPKAFQNLHLERDP